MYFQEEITTQIPHNSRLGWTFAGGFMPLTFDYDEYHRVYFRTLVTNSNEAKAAIPRVNQTYSFDVMPYPAIFSLAVTIDTGKLCKQMM